MNACPNCGTPRRPRHRFCWNCGALLNAQRELKQVTVLLADLCNSTAQVVQTDAEGGQAYLDLAFQQMSAAVTAYGGTRVQWRGDELLALFGAPIAQEDHALRACLAAIAMLEGMKARTVPEAPMAVRVGIDSGEVIAGPGSGDLSTSYRVDGAPVHLAARLEQLAPPGTAYVSGNTMQLVGGQIQAQALGKRSIRGFETPVEIHEIAVGLQGSAAAPLARRHFLGPFIGRSADIAALATLAESVVQGAFRAVGIRGDAGIGKSRLISELCSRLGDRNFVTVSVAARGYGSQTPYSLVADIVRALPVISDDAASDGPTQRSDDAASDGPTQRDAANGDERAEAHMAALTDLLGTGDPGEGWRLLTPLQRRERIANAFVWMVRERARRHPLALVVEDVFLADRSSMRLVESLARRLQSQPLLLLMSYRPDFVHRWAEAPWFVEHGLGRLSPVEVSQLADKLLGNDPSLTEMRSALLERAEGNPLFLEQMVMTLVDGGNLLGPPGAYCRAPTTSPLKVPASIMTIIGARVDRLPVGVKASLEAATIIGEPIRTALLASMRQIEEAEAERHLQQAMSGGLIVATVFSARGGYVFRHGLVQESVLAGMTRARRRQLHRVAFEALSARADATSSNAGTLAHHAFHGEQWLAAANHALSAMSRSIARSENKDALRVFDLGLNAARRVEPEASMLPCELALRLEALGAQMALGEFDAIVSNLERAEAITQMLKDLRRQAAVSLQLAVTLWACGSYRQGLSVATHAGNVAAAAGSRSVQMAALMVRMMLNHGLGRYVDANANGEQVEREFAAELRARRLLPGWAVIASINLEAFLADIRLWRGDLVASQTACDAGYRELQVQDHPFSRVLLDFVQGELLLAQRRPAEAAQLLMSALDLCRVHEVTNMHPPILAHLGGAVALSGRSAQALALLEPAIAQHASRAGGRYNEYYFPYFLAVALHEAGRIDGAITAAREACDAAASFEQRGHEARALLLLARLEALAGRQRDATDHLAESKGLAQECGMHWPLLESACEAGIVAKPTLCGQGTAQEDHA